MRLWRELAGTFDNLRQRLDPSLVTFGYPVYKIAAVRAANSILDRLLFSSFEITPMTSKEE